MTTPLELFVLEWGVYPRRVTIYLSEKGLLHSKNIKITPCSTTAEGKIDAPGKPPGSLPILVFPDGKSITQSLAVIQYFEDITDNPQETWQTELKEMAAISSGNSRSMRGRSGDNMDKARVREMLALADEVTSLACFACHKGSKLFETLEPTNGEGARLALEYCGRNLGLLDRYYGDFEERMANDSGPNIVDCVLFSILQYMKELFGKDLTHGRSNLARFYDIFKERESAKIPEEFYPGFVAELCPQWL